MHRLNKISRIVPATSVSQGMRLLACGVDPRSADMYWSFYITPTLCIGEIPRDNETGAVIDVRDTPAWSLPALLKLLPDKLEGVKQIAFARPFKHKKWDIVKSDVNNTVSGLLTMENRMGLWNFNYEPDGFMGLYPGDSNPIEGAVRMIELLDANKVSVDNFIHLPGITYPID